MRAEPREIIEKVASYYGHDPELLRRSREGLGIQGRKRERQEFVKTRQVIAYFLREFTPLIQADIAPMVGLKNRCTLTHSIKTVVNEYQYNKDFKKEVDEIRKTIVKDAKPEINEEVRLSLHYNLMQELGRKLIQSA